LIFCMKGSGAHGTAFLRGHGHMDQSTGADDRNQLAIEWITPEGELVRVGSPGSSNEWFTGDGPGPSLRSLISSSLPPGITPGIFTKSAMKLYHWQGPSKFPLEGVSPKYKMEVPPGFMARYYSFPSSDKMYEAEIKIGRSEIAFELMGFSISMVASNISTSNEEEAVIFEKYRKLIQGPGFYVIIASESPEEFEYKKKVLNQIIRETNGKSLEPIEEDPEIEATLIFGCTRITHSIRETFRAGGAFNSIPIMGQRDLTLKWVEGASIGKREMIKKGLIVDDAEAFFGWGVEFGHLGKSEIFCRFDPATPGAREAVLKWRHDQNKRAFDENYFAPVMGVIPIESIAPRMCNYPSWMEKFGKLIDPNRVQQRSGDII
jgi:glycolate oxidase